MGPTVLFTHLKIILLQYFQFSVFNFSNNKLNPNGPYVSVGNTKVAFGLRFWAAFQHLCFPSSFFFFLIENSVFTQDAVCQQVLCTVHGPTTSLTSKFCIEICLSVGHMHCSRDPQTSFFTQNFIKNGSHDTIHTFKNYFTTVFSIFSKIGDI